jgi:DNA gyrase/topoisomerase IV subunit B
MHKLDSGDDLIECPNCTELIQAMAIVCRFCHGGLSNDHFEKCAVCGEMIRKEATLCRFCLSNRGDTKQEAIRLTTVVPTNFIDRPIQEQEHKASPQEDFVKCPNCCNLTEATTMVCQYCQGHLSESCADLCPFCSEKITKEALGCKFCRSNLSAGSATEKTGSWYGLETVRARPATYIGSTGPRGLHHLVWEIIDNSVDEAVAGYCKNIFVTLNSDGSFTTLDDGRGISTDMVQQTGKTFLETQLSSLRGPGQFVQEVYTPTHALHKIGLGVVNALCERLEVEVHSNNVISRQVYGEGKAKGKLQILGATEQQGTSITLWPDREIFYDFDASKHLTKVTFDWDILVPRLRELAFLNKGLSISLTDKRGNDGQSKSEHFCFSKGIRHYVESLNCKRNILHKPPIYFERGRENIVVECAMQWTDVPEKTIHSFANNISTANGGTHLIGFYKGLIRSFNDYARKQGLIEEQEQDCIDELDLTEGLTAIVTVRVPQPQFNGQTKECLANSEVENYSEVMVYKAMSDWLKYNKTTAKALVTKAIDAHKARA